MSVGTTEEKKCRAFNEWNIKGVPANYTISLFYIDFNFSQFNFLTLLTLLVAFRFLPIVYKKTLEWYIEW